MDFELLDQNPNLKTVCFLHLSEKVGTLGVGKYGKGFERSMHGFYVLFAG